jgi:hypothetical protein
MHDSPRTRTRPTPGDLVDVAQQLARDAEATPAALRHRDRRIGQQLGTAAAGPVAQVLAWLSVLRRERDDLAGGRLDALHRLGLLVLGVAGLLAGWGAGAAVFHYDGTHPVNVIHVLAVFVLLQLLLVALFLLSSLPRAAARAVPGFAAFQDALQLLSPGKLQRLLARRLPQGAREALAAVAGRGRAHRQLFGAVDRWTISHASQVFALGFNLGAVLCALSLVVFSDLAFSWNTTLQLGAADMVRWTDLLSAPWAWAFADARPSGELIAATRYFRLGEGTFPRAVSPSGLGGWWPFLIMAMAVYGVLPRLLTLLLARWRLRRALGRALRQLPGLEELRERLDSELVESRALAGDAATDPGPGDLAAEASPPHPLAGRPVTVIAWAGAGGDPDAARGWVGQYTGAEPAAWQAAGGAHPLADDRAAIAAAAGADRPVVLLVKAWEPPLAEVLDFLRALRRALGEGPAVVVVPVGADASDRPTAPQPRHRDVWRRAVATVGDPWLRVWIAEGETP